MNSQLRIENNPFQIGGIEGETEEAISTNGETYLALHTVWSTESFHNTIAQLVEHRPREEKSKVLDCVDGVSGRISIKKHFNKPFLFLQLPISFKTHKINNRHSFQTNILLFRYFLLSAIPLHFICFAFYADRIFPF